MNTDTFLGSYTPVALNLFSPLPENIHLVKSKGHTEMRRALSHSHNERSQCHLKCRRKCLNAASALNELVLMAIFNMNGVFWEVSSIENFESVL